MDLVELLTVEDRFQLQGRGVVVTPKLLPPADGWKACSHTVAIVAPDGQTREAAASFEVWHVNIPDPKVAAQNRWALVVCFPALTKEQVPIGSRIMVLRSLRDSIVAPTES
jgi:hypothetical protein